ncbi:hypothetical protein HOO68_01490 [Candidatus Gracilibacteria bacterium]|nr:hypothetical protein [Candidatus Gracilibacteria bacterium]
MLPHIYPKYLQAREQQQAGNPEGVQGLVTNTRSIVDWMTLYKGISEQIASTLESQRQLQRSTGLERFHHDTDHMRLATMEQQGPSIFYYAQKVFSLPEDYVFQPKDFSRNIGGYMDALVFQPEFIPDDILIDLGLMNKEDKLPPLTRKSEQQKMEIRQENTQKKIATLPELKSILASARPLQIGQRSRYTGRILLLANGKYLVFQEQKKGTHERKKPNILYVPKVYDDMYSLLRSQEYALLEITERLKNWTMIHSELELLHTSWRLSSGDEKKSMIAGIQQKMRHSRIPQIVSARNRLMDVEYNHDEKDANRVLGARNDIHILVRSQEGKKGAIGYQRAMIAHQITNEECKFGFLKSGFISKLTEMDTSELEKYLNQDGYQLGSEFQKKITQAFAVLRGYVSSYASQSFIGEPFLSFIQALENELSERKNTHKDSLRSLLKITLAIKQYAYQIGIYQIKHGLKKNTPNDLIITNIDVLILLLDEKTFLPFVELKSSGQERFANMKANLLSLRSHIQGGKTIEALMQIEDILAKGF